MGQNLVKGETEEKASENVQMVVRQHPPTVPLLHRAAYGGDLEKVRELLTTVDPGSEPATRKLDDAKLTPLHHAVWGATSKSEEICRLLLETDARDPLCVGKEPVVDMQDSEGKTALHHAAASKTPRLVQLLLESKADPNIRDHKGRSPLLICAEGNSEAAIECAQLLLVHKGLLPYELCGPDGRCTTAAHIAAAFSADKMISFLLNNGIEHSRKDGQGMTPLMLASSAGDTEQAGRCIQLLLNVSTPEVINAKSDKAGHTALMMAAFRTNVKVLTALLRNADTDILTTDSEGRTALHWAVKAWFRLNSMACVKLLVEARELSWDEKQKYLYGVENAKQESPIDIAIKNRCIRITEYLLTAHPTPESWLKPNLMNKIYSKVPEAMLTLMNQSIKFNPATFGDQNEDVDVEFGPITGYIDPLMGEDDIHGQGPRQETNYLRRILDSPKKMQRRLLVHPLVQVFIDLKWRFSRILTIMAISFQFSWTLTYTCLHLELYAPHCADSNSPVTRNGTGGENRTVRVLLYLGFGAASDLEACSINYIAAKGFAWILLLFSFVFIVKEVYQMTRKQWSYLNSTNFVQIFVLCVSVVDFIKAVGEWQGSNETEEWLMILATCAVSLAWVLCLREVGKFPRCGIYAAMLKKSSWHLLKMGIFYIPLLVAFAVMLRNLVPGKGQFMYLPFAIPKVVTMMTGELNHEDTFYSNGHGSTSLSPTEVFGHLTFLVLVFVAAIALFNLLIGVAVNDVKSLEKEAELTRLANELEQIYFFESVILWVRKRILGFERWQKLFSYLNVTSTYYSDLGYSAFEPLKRRVKTEDFHEDLKSSIRSIMIPVEEA